MLLDIFQSYDDARTCERQMYTSGLGIGEVEAFRKHDNERHGSLNARIFWLNERQLAYKVLRFILVFREAR